MKFKLPSKFKVYDFISFTVNGFLAGSTVVLAGITLFQIVRFKKRRIPEIEEEVRLFKEAQLLKEQVERESMLMRDKQTEKVNDK